MTRFFLLGLSGALSFSFLWAAPALADSRAHLVIALARLDFQAEPPQVNKTDNDRLRKFTLTARFRVEGFSGATSGLKCRVRFNPDPLDRDEWGNVVDSKWHGLVASKLFFNVGGGAQGPWHHNMAVLPKGGDFPCSDSTFHELEIAGYAVGGNVSTWREPELVKDTAWMAEFLPPLPEKVLLFLGDEVIVGKDLQIELERSPSRSHRHSSEFTALEWAKGTPGSDTTGLEMIRGFAQWPAF